MSAKEPNTNGNGNRALNILQTLMLAAILGGGGFFATMLWNATTANANQLNGFRFQLNEFQYQLISLTNTIGDISRGRWTWRHQVEYNTRLGNLNATLRVPDVRQIMREQEP